MQWFALVVSVVFSTMVWASEGFPIAQKNPRPVYSKVLVRAGITGNVVVAFTAHSDGSVSKVRVRQSDHPELALASTDAVRQWRYQPWSVSDDTPAEVEVVAPMAFRLYSDLPEGLNEWLKTVKCREITESLRDIADYAWVDSDVFYKTRGYLLGADSTAHMPNEQRLDLISKLNRRAPDIVRECRNSPISKFSRHLPADIRKLL
ncbi:energy transducer TonB [Pseudomonas prosekii]|uniref:Energy transducer TonB n=1 Tax=Pseudomonas prosekii TaxID=1148509 RepID=A0A3L8CW78_9PSED|nr:energy transducer TonB [Pseudomonas prosekii]RLU07214.1 energy transducer TonB [Pseudomonas prosekii]RLU12517.1 energy transducer TonB [Pseudomonas prosekii]